MIKSLVRGTILALVLGALFTTNTYAQYGYGGYGQYGSGPTPSILIDKLVGKVASDKGSTSLEFVDNLAPSDARFKAEEVVTFKLKVKNTSDVAINGVAVKDTLPSFVTPVDQPGSYDATNRIITINAGDFKAGEQKEYIVKVKLSATQDLPQDRTVVCLINKSRVESGNLSDEDTAQFCVEHEVGVTPTPTSTVTTATEVPSTGPQDLPFILGFEVLALTAGLHLKRRTYS